uniref:Uncharacterized protein n=1 Tax=Ananas comosus var. bracteatus TaxID=296719 RepID=A0A6V7PTD9_ANACO|nr:unnamed protein product [Ananas comosus var. bracteatus]
MWPCQAYTAHIFWAKAVLWSARPDPVSISARAGPDPSCLASVPAWPFGLEGTDRAGPGRASAPLGRGSSLSPSSTAVPGAPAPRGLRRRVGHVALCRGARRPVARRARQPRARLPRRGQRRGEHRPQRRHEGRRRGFRVRIEGLILIHSVLGGGGDRAEEAERRRGKMKGFGRW